MKILDKRVTIQSHGAAQDENGEVVAGWTDVATVWAGIADIKGREFIAAGATQNAVHTKITIRYRTGIVAAMRVVCGADIYNIEAVLGQDKRTLLLMCSRGTP